MHSMLLDSGRSRCLGKNWGEAKWHHTIALKELRTQIAEFGSGDSIHLKGTIEMVACMMQLISFEVLSIFAIDHVTTDQQE